jgi:hypothetical protein
MLMATDHHLQNAGRDVRDCLVVREVEDELLVLDTRADQVHQLNRSASLIWRLYSDGASTAEIAERLASEFEVSVETAQRDTEETLSRLRALSLIERGKKDDVFAGAEME